MKNPLYRRFPRELKSEPGKYIVIFAFIAGMIGIVSGFLVSGRSIMASYNENYDKYSVEDGNFELYEEADASLTEKLVGIGAAFYENYYIEQETDDIDSTVRIFKNRGEINRACVMSGELPGSAGEIAVDRVYAQNNGISVGDTVDISGKSLTVSGFVALPDYCCLFRSTSDMVFDSIKFCVAVMTEDGFDEMGGNVHYCYSWRYGGAPSDDSEAKSKAEDVLELLVENTKVKEFIPAYKNQAIIFARDDIGSDTVTMLMLLYIMMAVISFVFAITTSNTVAKEANVIGTLRASGYTRGELIFHYLAMPTAVTLVAALVGNIFGYTCFKDFAAGLLFKSYGLTTYTTIWNADAFLKTTVMPVVIIVLINFVILARKLRLSPLRFIRRDLSVRKKKKAIRLNTKMSIMTRFRLRVIFQNIPNYVMIFVGILLANIILLFGCGLMPLLRHNQDEIIANMIANNQYVLKAQTETDCADAEKYCAETLKTTDKNLLVEDVMIYGIADGSRYIDLDFSGGVYVSSAFAAKHSLSAGGTAVLRDSYEHRDYTFEIGGVYEYPAGLAVFMSAEKFNEVFGKSENYFSGYFSDTEITDIDGRLIALTITADDYTKTSRQFEVSFSEMATMIKAFGIIVFVLIIYLLSKIIIEKNTQSISMTKILGYSSAEINGLYIASTAIVVVLSVAASIPLANAVMAVLLPAAMMNYSGYFFYFMPPEVFVTMALLGVAGYGVIAFAQTRRVKKIPLDIALKNVE